jgi:hypothetical protein
MPDSAETDLILKYLGDDGNRLDVALAIHDAFDEILGRVVQVFILRLKEDVAKQLTSSSETWTVDLNWTTKQRENRLLIKKEGWVAECCVYLGRDFWGPKRLYVGIWTDNSNLTSKLSEKFPDWGDWQGKALDWSLSRDFGGDWQMADWTQRAAIRAMHEGVNGLYHQRVRDRLIATARSADDILRS